MPVPTPAALTPALNCHAHANDPKEPHQGKKKIFVFCDGTGNEFADGNATKGANSNVVKLYTTLRVNDAQVAYYHPGVGTMGNPSIRFRLPRFWSKVKGLAFGSGFRDNVLDAYRYVMDVYNDGDEVYIFGFSRGAYTARALAGMLHSCGLLCRGNEGHLLYAWKVFHDAVQGKRNLLKKAPDHRGRHADRAHSIERNYAFAQTFSRNVTVRFMGVWDTVSSVGWIYTPLRLLDMARNPIIQVGRHAVSIDERRAFYRDNLWGHAISPNDAEWTEWPDELKSRNIQQDIAQVWFPGVHSDVGGSYAQNQAAPANEALRWMIGELQQHGAELCQERIDMVLGTPSGVHDADKIYAPAPPPDHMIHDSLKGIWWLLQAFPQQYYDKEDGKIQWRVPYGRARTIPRGSFIHKSAERRMRETVPGEEPYRPRNMKLNQLRTLETPLGNTTADLRGCFVYEPGESAKAHKDSTAVRMAKLLLGWLTFGAFWLLVGAVVWYVVGALVFLVLCVVGLIAHTPGFRCVFRWLRGYI